MDDYTQPKDAKKFMWGTPKSSMDQDNEEEEEEHYSEPYQHMPTAGPVGPNWKSSANKPNPAFCGNTAKTATPSRDNHCAKDFQPPPVTTDNYNCLTLNGGTQPKSTHPDVVLRGSNQGSRGDSSFDRPVVWDRRSTDNSGTTNQNWRGKAVAKRKSNDKIRPNDFLPVSNPPTSSNNNNATNIAGGMNPNSGMAQDAGPALYEDAWDTVQQQRKWEENLRLARSISSTSEKFEDALEFLPEDWAPSRQKSPGSQVQGQRSGVGQGQKKAEPDPVTGGNYEKAWDLNRNLEEKLRLLQMHPPDSAAAPATEDEGSSNYMEPWDTAKKQRELEEKIQLARTGGGGVGAGGQPHHHHNQAAVHPVNPPKMFQPAKHGQVEESVYEEAWDTKRGLSQILQASHHAEGSGGSTRSSHHSPHCIIGEQVNAMIPLQNQDWYHGNISRDDAEKQLVVCKDGSYLLRDSSDRCHYTLSIKSPLMMIHIQIDQCQAPDGSMRYVLGKNSKAFRTVPAMIDFYTQHPMPIKGAEHMTLLHPVQCHWSQANDDTRI